MVAEVRFRKPRSRTSLRRRVFCLRPNEVLDQHKSLWHLIMLVSLLFLLSNRRPDLVAARETLRKGIFQKIQDLLQLMCYAIERPIERRHCDLKFTTFSDHADIINLFFCLDSYWRISSQHYMVMESRKDLNVLHHH